MPSSEPEDGWGRLYDDITREEREHRASQPSGQPPALKSGEAVPDIPRYEISGIIGQGAAGVVYKAWDRELHRPVALKILRPSVAHTDVARQRFRREAQAAANLAHPHVVAAYDAGEHDGFLYLVMELVDGRPLSDILAERKWPRADLVRLLERAARGVGEAHAKGIIHRDLKPSNILVKTAAEPKVADFGLAHLVDSSTELTRTGTTLGTPLYMSPEQVEGHAHEITPRTDVYALGAILYEILTGRPPHVGETLMEVYGRIVHQDPVPPRALNPETPRELETIALKALEKEPERRYPTASDFAEDVRRHLEGEPVLARPASLAYRLSRKLRRNRLAVTLAGGILAAVIAAFVLWLAGTRKAHRLEVQSQEALLAIRGMARVSLDGALGFRRVGANERMAQFVPPLEDAYRRSLQFAPEVAELDYLMGRLYRALMEDEKAEQFQERALSKDPRYAPALYERAILMAARLGDELDKAIWKSKGLPAGSGSVEAARELPILEPEDVESRHDRLVDLRERILKDGASLQQVIASGRAGAGLEYITEAHLKTVEGLLAHNRRDYEEARRKLEEVVQKNPTIEEAWAALCTTATRQAALVEDQSPKREDALKALDEVEQLWSRAISHDAGYAPHWIGRAYAVRRRGIYFMIRGGDPVPEFRKAEADLTRVLEYKTKALDALLRRGGVRNLLGVCLTDSGRDPTADLDAAEQDLTEALSRFGELAGARSARGSVRVHRAIYQLRRNQDPLQALSAAEEDLQKAIQLVPDSPYFSGHQTLGQVNLLRASHRRRLGQDPLPDLDRARACLSEAIHFNRATPSMWTQRARVGVDRGGYLSSLGRDPLEDFIEAEKDFSQAVRLNPSRGAMARAERGRLRSLIGRHYESLNQPQAAAGKYAEALQDFDKAFELNRTLEPRFAADYGEARKRLDALQPR